MADEKIRYVLDVDDKGTPKLVKFGATAAKAGDQASKGFAKAGKAVGDFGQQLPGVSGALGMFSGGPAVAAGAAVSALAVGFGAIVSKSIDMADNLNDLSLRLGVSTERLSVLSLYADQSGTDIETLATAMGKLGVKLNEGDKDLKGYGITAGSVDEALFQLADKIAATTDPMLRLKIATDAFGKSGQQMLPLLVQGGAALRKMADAAPIVSTEFAQMADQLNDRVAEMKGRFTAVGLGIAESVLPFLDKWLDGVERILEALGMVPEAQKRANERAKIIEQFSVAQQGSRTRSVDGQTRVGGKTLREALAEFDKANAKPSGPPAPMAGKIGGGSTTTGGKVAPNVVDYFAATGTDFANTQYRYNQAQADRFAASKAGDHNGAENQVDFVGMPPDYYAGLPVSEKGRESLEKQYDEAAQAEDERTKTLLASRQAMAEKSADILVQSGMAGFQVFDDMFARMAARNAEMEDSWTKTFQGIGLAFSTMLTKMLEEMAVKAAVFAAFNLFSGGQLQLGGGLMKFLGFASGGMPPEGAPSIVGERRPEVFIPRGPGHVQPTTGTGTTINITVSNPAEARSVARQLQREERTRKTGLRS